MYPEMSTLIELPASLCPICMEKYSATRNIPLVLNCGHSLCGVCFGTASRRKPNFELIQCPFCRDDITQVERRVNFQLICLVQELEQVQKEHEYMDVQIESKITSANNDFNGRVVAFHGIPLDYGIQEVYELMSKYGSVTMNMSNEPLIRLTRIYLWKKLIGSGTVTFDTSSMAEDTVEKLDGFQIPNGEQLLSMRRRKTTKDCCMSTEDEFLSSQCPVCMEHYSEQDKKALVINCGHSLCINCYETVSERKSFFDTIKCPVCGDNVLQIKQRINFQLLSLVDEAGRMRERMLTNPEEFQKAETCEKIKDLIEDTTPIPPIYERPSENSSRIVQPNILHYPRQRFPLQIVSPPPRIVLNPHADRTVCYQGMPLQMSRKEIRKVFASVGKITKKGLTVNRHLGTGAVLFRSHRDALLSVSRLNGLTFFNHYCTLSVQMWQDENALSTASGLVSVPLPSTSHQVLIAASEFYLQSQQWPSLGVSTAQGDVQLEGRSAEEVDLDNHVDAESDILPIIREDSESAVLQEDSHRRPAVQEDSDLRPIIQEDSGICPVSQGDSEIRPTIQESSDLRPIIQEDSGILPVSHEESQICTVFQEDSEIRSVLQEDSESGPAAIQEDSDLRPTVQEDEVQIASGMVYVPSIEVEPTPIDYAACLQEVLDGFVHLLFDTTLFCIDLVVFLFTER